MQGGDPYFFSKKKETSNNFVGSFFFKWHSVINEFYQKYKNGLITEILEACNQSISNSDAFPKWEIFKKKMSVQGDYKKN